MPELGAILTAIVTPFDDRLEINEEAFVRLLHHVVDHGSDGVVAAATTGEAPTLTELEAEVMTILCNPVDLLR